MSFPSSTGTRKGLAQVYGDAKRTANMLKSRTQDVRAKAAAGTWLRFDALQYLTNCTDALADFASAAAQPGIGAYAQNQENDPGLNLATEFTVMVDAVTAARDWLSANYPVSAQGFTETFKINAQKRYADPGFPAGSVAALLPLLDAVIAAID